MTPPYRLRTFLESDIAAAHRLCAQVGWPHRPDDLGFMTGLGHAIAVENGGGDLVGCGVWWPHGEAAGTLGLIMVSPHLQGRGIGGLMMRHLLAEAGPRRLSLNATAAGRTLYERDGFIAVATIGQHQGIVGPGTAASRPPDGRVRAYEPSDAPQLVALDRAATGGSDRTALLEALARRSTGWVQEVGGHIAGFAFTRAFGRGHLVGPLVAPDDATAIALLRPALEAHAGAFLRVDTPLSAGSFVEALGVAGLREIDVALTMVRGERARADDVVRIYCLASQAFG